ncbi:hypothetical protein KBT16_04380 [Nostoc sp. CCCryo 231-06]|nr:hypothetical protein [Nostoc sp. CCCryo 231-06]
MQHTDTPSLRPACDRIIEARQATAMHWVLVAGSLVDARSLLVKRAILFTGHNNQAVYRGIGFLPTGEKYGLVLFES